jgi:hypothetical protein
MTDQTCGCGSGNFSADQVSQAIDQRLASLDTQRASKLAGLQTIRTAKVTGYNREQRRLTLKYGADSPRVAALTDKIQINNGLRRDVAFETDRAQTPAPTTDPASYVFHGFVRDMKGQAVPQLTIGLYDESNNWIQAIGYGCTDERGYFLMRSQSVGTGASPAGAGERAAAADTKFAARIYVLDSKKNTLQIEKQPLYPQLGSIDFRIIILGGQSAPCTPPPQTGGEPAPPPTTTTTSTPLEEIRGIGPVRARQLRTAGIKDIETLLKTDMAKLVDILGTDANAVKRQAAAKLKKKKGK